MTNDQSTLHMIRKGILVKITKGRMLYTTTWSSHASNIYALCISLYR